MCVFLLVVVGCGRWYCLVVVLSLPIKVLG